MSDKKQVIEFGDPVRFEVSRFDQITEDLVSNVTRKPGAYWYFGLIVSFIFLMIGAYCAYLSIYLGLGTWNLNQTVVWGMSITTFIWWIGIGHAGTFISAILLLFHQKWRTSINRAAETMTLLALLCAAFFPIIHMGRQLLAFFTLPYPNTRNLGINFSSPLVWDVFAISTYFIISLLFWYQGLIPDLATLRDRAKTPVSKWFYSTFSLGWNGSAFDWARHEKLNYYLAVIATPLVISVHSIVSLDFATTLVPGWHSTQFPIYFVAGAIFSGFAMVQILIIVTRKVLELETYILPVHFELMNKIILITGSLVAFAYFTEILFFLLSDNMVERDVLLNRLNGKNSFAFYFTLICNVLTPQLLWIKRIRTNLLISFFISMAITVGMWFERYVIVVGSLQHDHLPAKWTSYHPSLTETGLFIGTIGFFFFFFLLIMRIIPFISIIDTRQTVLKQSK